MKLGAFNLMFYHLPFEEAVATIKEFGCETIEIGCGAIVQKKHVNPAELLEDKSKLQRFRKTIEDAGLLISAYSVHANMIHPNKSLASEQRRDFRDAILLAEQTGVDRIVTFAGCAGDHENAIHPNWVTCPWPDEFSEIVEWQWNERLIPFWREEVAFARQHGVNKICLEMHPGDMVYNPEKLLRLRQAVGEEIGCNFDPSHLFWQGIDPRAAVRKLGDCIYHSHAKDSKVDPFNTQVNGVLDTKRYQDEANRAWIFRTVGYGHDSGFWTDLVSTFRLVGYDYVLSIEHEDSLLSAREGLEKAVSFLKEILIRQPRGAMWWD